MAKVAFLDVDTQVDFVEPGGKLYAQGAEAIKPNLKRLVETAQARSVPLISCVDAHPEDDPEFADWPPHAIQGTPGQRKVAETRTDDMVFVPNAPSETLPDPRVRHVVLEKQQFPVFTSRVAERVLASAGADTYVVFGVVTEVCVKHAVLGLLERGYTVRVVEDAIWPIDAANGEQALAEMEAKGAVRTTTDAVLEGLERPVESAR